MNVTRQAEVGAGSLTDSVSSEPLFSSDQLIRLLVSIRASSMPKDLKMSLRDMVLEYSQIDGAEKKLKLQADIKAALLPYANEFPSITPGLKKSAAPPLPENGDAPKPGIGRSRVQPSFNVKPVQSKPINSAPAAEPNPVMQEETASASKAEPAADIPAKKTETIPNPPVQKEAHPSSEQATEEKTAVISQKAPESAPSAVPDIPNNTDYKARITAIKHTVNDRIGNPVNLIDKNREVGQEYMSALLDAMKRTAGGAGGGSSAAMKRLETAFNEVMRVINETDAVEPSEESREIRKTDAETPKIPAREPTPSVQKDLGTQTSIPVLPDEGNKIPIKRIESTAIHAPNPLTSKSADAPVRMPSSPQQSERLKSIVQQNIASEHAVTQPKIDSVSRAMPPQQSESAPAPLKSLNAVVSAKESKIVSLPTAVPPKIVRPNVQSEIAAKAQELSDRTPSPEPEVEAGLAQLLSEWSLFKRSGFFGTGPHGKDHPLYLQLAKLPMAAIIAGRFEGATPEIKQSIADYLNGWRYEQGIVHKMEEHFEQYLKRVIRHILEKSKSAPK